MSITNDGIQGEKEARTIIKNNIKGLETLFQLDWIYKVKNKYVCVEVKNKDFFNGPPFDGYGLNKYQLDTRLRFYKDTDIRCLFLCICNQHNCIYYQWLDILNKNNKFITKNRIIIFPLENFVKINKKDLIL